MVSPAKKARQDLIHAVSAIRAKMTAQHIEDADSEDVTADGEEEEGSDEESALAFNMYSLFVSKAESVERAKNEAAVAAARFRESRTAVVRMR